MQTTQPDTEPAVIIVGAGIAGLACARVLEREGVSYLLLEADKRIGGRIKTDVVDGHQLDHGFQVLQAAYPEARRVLDYKALQLRAFSPGVMIRIGNRFYPVADPIRMPRHLISSIRAPIGSLADKVRLARLAWQVSSRSLEDLFSDSESATLDFLQARGFSATMIERFFRPFFSGITLDRHIRASSRMFTYVLKMFAQGDVVLPARGMASIPGQLARGLSSSSLLTGQRVIRVGPHAAVLESGRRMTAGRIVLATNGPDTARLLNLDAAPASCSTACVYFSADEPPIREKLLLLNGNGTGPVNTISIPSLVAPRYAPPDRTLIAATVLSPYLEDGQNLERTVLSQLESWFGTGVQHWRHLRTFFINHALPLQAPPLPNPLAAHKRRLNGVWIAGEYNNVASIQWSLYAGRRTGEHIVKEIRGG